MHTHLDAAAETKKQNKNRCINIERWYLYIQSRGVSTLKVVSVDQGGEKNKIPNISTTPNTSARS
jgi:hypothetical protein